MTKKPFTSSLIAVSIVIGTLFAASNAHAQAKNCLPIPAVNQLVATKAITSFNKVKKSLKLPKGAKIFNQRLCQVDGKYVYFFKIVDAKGKARGMALNALDGKPLPNKG